MATTLIPRHRYTKWTPARTAELTRLWNARRRVIDIAAALGTSPKAVYKKVWTLRNRGAEAHKRKAGRPRKEEKT